MPLDLADILTLGPTQISLTLSGGREFSLPPLNQQQLMNQIHRERRLVPVKR